mmetsp:Transcript_14493/g.36393  ORF Transcript_14493/g.36393 Transcript_14493/m.36393 type:complete len:236 (-) Transcript_14493:1113-1820(-)
MPGSCRHKVARSSSLWGKWDTRQMSATSCNSGMRTSSPKGGMAESGWLHVSMSSRIKYKHPSVASQGCLGRFTSQLEHPILPAPAFFLSLGARDPQLYNWFSVCASTLFCHALYSSTVIFGCFLAAGRFSLMNPMSLSKKLWSIGLAGLSQSHGRIRSDAPNLVRQLLRPSRPQGRHFNAAFLGIGPAKDPTGQTGLVADGPRFVVEAHQQGLQQNYHVRLQDVGDFWIHSNLDS